MAKKKKVQKLGIKAVLPPRDCVDAVDKLVCNDLDVGSAENPVRGPRNRSVNNGPNLPEHRRKPGEELPSPNVFAGDGGTHDVNDEMLAKAYRRGLRVRGMNRIKVGSLDFLIR